MSNSENLIMTYKSIIVLDVTFTDLVINYFLFMQAENSRNRRAIQMRKQVDQSTDRYSPSTSTAGRSEWRRRHPDFTVEDESEKN